MQHPFDALKDQYASWWSSMRVDNVHHARALKEASKLLQNRAAYMAVQAQTGVPAAFLMALNNRESDGNLNTYLGNGDFVIGSAAMTQGRKTHDVPRGRGPFPSWSAGAIDAIRYDGLDKIKNWTMPMTLYEGEVWNGFGYRNHGRRSPYLVGGTNLQQPGRYAGDGNWQSDEWDTQLGIMPVMAAIFELAPDMSPVGTEVIPTPPSIDQMTMEEIQTALNKHGAELTVDGIYGRRTRTAVMDFQTAHPPLVVDGIPGPETIAEFKALG